MTKTTVYDDITDLLDGNGEVDPETRGRYTLLALREIGRDLEQVKGLEKRVETLERNSIIRFIKDNPKTSSFIIFLIFIAFNAWFVSDFRKTILVVLGLPEDLIP